MRLRIGAALALLPIAACNNNEAANNGAGPAPVAPASTAAAPPPPPAAAAPQPDLEEARVLIGQIYQPYLRGQSPRIGNRYTPELAIAIARQSDGDNGLGYDPFCRCQDFENFRYTIQSVERREGGARAVVSFTNLGESHRVTLLLDHRGDRWLIADVQEGSDSLLAGGRAQR